MDNHIIHIHIYSYSIGHPSYSWWISTIYDVCHTWYTSIINDRHYLNMMGNHQFRSIHPTALLSGPSLTSKPLQEHKFDNYRETLPMLTVQNFTFHISEKNVQSLHLMQKWNFWNPVAKFDIDPTRLPRCWTSTSTKDQKILS